MRALEGGDQDRKAIKLTNGSTISFAAGGCQSTAYRILYGDSIAWAKVTYVPQALNVQLAKQVAGNPTYQAAIQHWANCMTERGYAATDPSQIQAELKSQYQRLGASSALRQQEIAIGVADGECAKKIHLTTLALDLKKSLAATLAPTDQEELKQTTKSWTAAVAASQEINRPK